MMASSALALIMTAALVACFITGHQVAGILLACAALAMHHDIVSRGL